MLSICIRLLALAVVSVIETSSVMLKSNQLAYYMKAAAPLAAPFSIWINSEN